LTYSNSEINEARCGNKTISIVLVLESYRFADIINSSSDEKLLCEVEPDQT
jgi:hypothetical protein